MTIKGMGNDVYQREREREREHKTLLGVFGIKKEAKASLSHRLCDGDAFLFCKKGR